MQKTQLKTLVGILYHPEHLRAGEFKQLTDKRRLKYPEDICILWNTVVQKPNFVRRSPRRVDRRSSRHKRAGYIAARLTSSSPKSLLRRTAGPYIGSGEGAARIGSWPRARRLLQIVT